MGAYTREERGVVRGLARLAIDGQVKYAQTMRELLERVEPGLMERLSGIDDHTLLEPFLFAYFTGPQPCRTVTLDQLFAERLLRRQDRPIEVIADADGWTFLAGVGFVRSASLHPAPSPGAARSWVTAREIDDGLAPRCFVGGTVELMPHYLPLLDQFFGADACSVAPTITEASEELHEPLSNALRLFRDVWPELYDALDLVLRRVVLFRSDHLNSFATTSAHGAVFINVALGDTETFFLEDLAHQAGHVLVAAATYDPFTLLSCEPGTPLADLAARRDGVVDNRTIYVALHGLVTEAFMSALLAACIEHQVVPPAQIPELLGRCAFIFKRFTHDLATVGGLSVFTPLGRQTLRGIASWWAAIANRYGPLFAPLDMSNQAYNFSYERYIAANGDRIGMGDVRAFVRASR